MPGTHLPQSYLRIKHLPHGKGKGSTKVEIVQAFKGVDEFIECYSWKGA